MQRPLWGRRDRLTLCLTQISHAGESHVCQDSRRKKEIRKYILLKENKVYD